MLQLRRTKNVMVAVVMGTIGSAALAQEARIDFGSSSFLTASSAGKYWNNLTNPLATTTSSLVNYSTGTALPWSVKLTDTFAGVNTSGTTSATGEAATLFGVNATRDSFYTNQRGEVTIGNLNPTHTYSVKLFGSYTTLFSFLNYSGNYTQTGATTKTTSFNATNNRSTVLSYADVKPGSAGSIKLTITPSSGSSAAFINGMQIVDTTPVETAKNLLFFGNSFTMMNDLTPSIAEIAVADKHVRPNIVMEAADSRTLSDQITQINTNPQNNVGKLPAGQQWSNVIMQEYSTGATNKLGNPTQFKADTKTIYNLVKAGSPGVKPVLYETWSYMPTDTNVYGTLSYQYANPSAMQADIRTNYNAAAAEINSLYPGAGATVATAGDDWEKLNYASDLYFGFDTKHPSARGSLIAELELYKKIYNENVSDIPYSAVQTWYQVRSITAADWAQMTALVDGLPAPVTASLGATSAQSFSVVPEPASLSLFSIGAALLLRRRREGSTVR